MPKIGRRVLWALSLVALGAAFGVSEVDFLPEGTTPQADAFASPSVPKPVPMSAMDIKSLAKSRSSGQDTLLLSPTVRQNGEIAVRFKMLSIDDEQEAGIILRYQDPKNYYVVAASLSGDNCVLYRVKDGKLKKINSQYVLITPLAWHELRVTFAQDNITAILDRDTVLGVKDSSIKNAGQIGLWIKAGSSVGFDNFRVSRS